MRTCARTLLAALALAGCAGPGKVDYIDGHCWIDGAGRPATLPEIETHQAQLTERIASHQPLFVAVTILVVCLAGLSHADKLTMFRRGSSGRPLGERFRAALEREKQHPVRYFALLGATLSLLAMAGSFYVWLDADKRASERALQLLQFCHLAERSGQAHAVLDEQKHNLESIEATAGSIRALVDKLPPEEQRKGEEIVRRISSSIKEEQQRVADAMLRNDASALKAREQSALLAHGLTTLEQKVGALAAVPTGVKDVSDRVAALDGKVGSTSERLAAVEAALKALAQKPAPTCPACVCNPPPPPPVEKHATPLDGGTAKTTP